MKIAISSTGEKINSLMDLRFGRCEYFQIYNTETKELKAINNTGLTCSGGAGIAAAQQLIDENIDVVITGSLGPNAFKIISTAEIKAFKGVNTSTEILLEKLKSNELEEIKIAGPEHNGINH